VGCSSKRSPKAKRNFTIYPPLDFLANITQHIPDKGKHLLLYYGWYSNKKRGLRKKGESAAQKSKPQPQKALAEEHVEHEDVKQEEFHRQARQSWAVLIKRIYETDPLLCPYCNGKMKVISFIERRQRSVIEKILKHCGLWQDYAN